MMVSGGSEEGGYAFLNSRMQWKRFGYFRKVSKTARFVRGCATRIGVERERERERLVGILFSHDGWENKRKRVGKKKRVLDE